MPAFPYVIILILSQSLRQAVVISNRGSFLLWSTLPSAGVCVTANHFVWACVSECVEQVQGTSCNILQYYKIIPRV